MAQAAEPAEITNKKQAKGAFKRLVAQYGLQWTAQVPRAAYDLLASCNRFLNEGDRREALGLRR